MTVIVRILLELAMETYLRGVLPAEVPPLWHMEALCAQAIAARSYAYWKIDHPDGTEFDVWGDERGQAYNPTMHHKRTDKAVDETRGMILTRQGEPFMPEYVSNCGRPDCPLCMGKRGFDSKQWSDRLCQHGANYLAERGWSAIRILRLYYGDSVMVEIIPGLEDSEERRMNDE